MFTLDSNPSDPPGGHALLTQQNTIYDPNINAPILGRGMAIQPNSGSQGDTNTIINGFFSSFMGDIGLEIHGCNALNNVVIGTDFQFFTRNGIENDCGQIMTCGTHSENYMGNNQYSFSPILTQFTRFGAAVQTRGSVTGSGTSLIYGWRAEDNILFDGWGGATSPGSGAGTSVIGGMVTSGDILNWAANGLLQIGVVIGAGTKNRNFMLVDDGGPPWDDIASAVGGSNTITTTATLTPGAWVGRPVLLRHASNGRFNACTITANTANTITWDSAGCGVTYSSQESYKIAGITGGSPPNWDAIATGSQSGGTGPGNGNLGFITYAGEACIGAGDFGGSVGDYVVVPDMDHIAPTLAGPNPIFPIAFVASVTAMGAGPCPGHPSDVGNHLTVSHAPAYSFNGLRGYYGTPTTDGQVKWINVAYDSVYRATVLQDALLSGQISTNGIVQGIQTSRTDWLDTKFSSSSAVYATNFATPSTIFGASYQRPCVNGSPGGGFFPGGPLDITPYVANCNVIYLVAPAGSANFTFPNANAAGWVNSYSSELTIVISANASRTHTFGTGFSANGPITTGATITNPTVIVFRLVNDGVGDVVWQEVTRSVGAFATSYTIANLPSCTAGTNAGLLAMVTNGVASPTYNSAVSTTGTTNNLVFCNGSGWTYH